MNFTREPIIETIISPKEGNKLLVRSSRGSATAEEYHVDAVEVVSFGRAFFFRSMERPKAFLLPVTDYEVLEVKEPRVALKTPSHERHIKIGGGRAQAKEAPLEQEVESFDEEEEISPAPSEEESSVNSRSDKRRDRRRRRHRRPSDEQEWNARKPSSESPEGAAKVQGGATPDETKVSSSILPSLIPPPSTLISQTLSRYKGKDFMEEPALPKTVEETSSAPSLENESNSYPV